MTSLVIKSLCACLICKGKNSYFSEYRAARFLSEEQLMEGLKWAGRLRWFVVGFSGAEEEEEVAQTKGVRGNTDMAGSCCCIPGVPQCARLV